MGDGKINSNDTTANNCKNHKIYSKLNWLSTLRMSIRSLGASISKRAMTTLLAKKASDTLSEAQKLPQNVKITQQKNKKKQVLKRQVQESSQIRSNKANYKAASRLSCKSRQLPSIETNSNLDIQGLRKECRNSNNRCQLDEENVLTSIETQRRSLKLKKNNRMSLGQKKEKFVDIFDNFDSAANVNKNQLINAKYERRKNRTKFRMNEENCFELEDKSLCERKIRFFLPQLLLASLVTMRTTNKKSMNEKSSKNYVLLRRNLNLKILTLFVFLAMLAIHSFSVCRASDSLNSTASQWNVDLKARNARFEVDSQALNSNQSLPQRQDTNFKIDNVNQLSDIIDNSLTNKQSDDNSSWSLRRLNTSFAVDDKNINTINFTPIVLQPSTTEIEKESMNNDTKLFAGYDFPISSSSDDNKQEQQVKSEFGTKNLVQNLTSAPTSSTVRNLDAAVEAQLKLRSTVAQLYFNKTLAFATKPLFASYNQNVATNTENNTLLSKTELTTNTTMAPKFKDDTNNQPGLVDVASVASASDSNFQGDTSFSSPTGARNLVLPTPSETQLLPLATNNEVSGIGRSDYEDGNDIITGNSGTSSHVNYAQFTPITHSEIKFSSQDNNVGDRQEKLGDLTTDSSSERRRSRWAAGWGKRKQQANGNNGINISRAASTNSSNNTNNDVDDDEDEQQISGNNIPSVVENNYNNDNSIVENKSQQENSDEDDDGNEENPISQQPKVSTQNELIPESKSKKKTLNTNSSGKIKSRKDERKVIANTIVDRNREHINNNGKKNQHHWSKSVTSRKVAIKQHQTESLPKTDKNSNQNNNDIDDDVNEFDSTSDGKQTGPQIPSSTIDQPGVMLGNEQQQSGDTTVDADKDIVFNNVVQDPKQTQIIGTSTSKTRRKIKPNKQQQNNELVDYEETSSDNNDSTDTNNSNNDDESTSSKNNSNLDQMQSVNLKSTAATISTTKGPSNQVSVKGRKQKIVGDNNNNKKVFFSPISVNNTSLTVAEQMIHKQVNNNKTPTNKNINLIADNKSHINIDSSSILPQNNENDDIIVGSSQSEQDLPKPPVNVVLRNQRKQQPHNTNVARQTTQFSPMMTNSIDSQKLNQQQIQQWPSVKSSIEVSDSSFVTPNTYHVNNYHQQHQIMQQPTRFSTQITQPIERQPVFNLNKNNGNYNYHNTQLQQQQPQQIYNRPIFTNQINYNNQQQQQSKRSRRYESTSPSSMIPNFDAAITQVQPPIVQSQMFVSDQHMRQHQNNYGKTLINDHLERRLVNNNQQMMMRKQPNSDVNNNFIPSNEQTSLVSQYQNINQNYSFNPNHNSQNQNNNNNNVNMMYANQYQNQQPLAKDDFLRIPSNFPTFPQQQQLYSTQAPVSLVNQKQNIDVNNLYHLQQQHHQQQQQQHQQHHQLQQQPQQLQNSNTQVSGLASDQKQYVYQNVVPQMQLQTPVAQQSQPDNAQQIPTQPQLQSQPKTISVRTKQSVVPNSESFWNQFNGKNGNTDSNSNLQLNAATPTPSPIQQSAVTSTTAAIVSHKIPETNAHSPPPLMTNIYQQQQQVSQAATTLPWQTTLGTSQQQQQQQQQQQHQQQQQQVVAHYPNSVYDHEMVSSHTNGHAYPLINPNRQNPNTPPLNQQHNEEYSAVNSAEAALLDSSYNNLGNSWPIHSAFAQKMPLSSNPSSLVNFNEFADSNDHLSVLMSSAATSQMPSLASLGDERNVKSKMTFGLQAQGLAMPTITSSSSKDSNTEKNKLNKKGARIDAKLPVAHPMFVRDASGWPAGFGSKAADSLMKANNIAPASELLILHAPNSGNYDNTAASSNIAPSSFSAASSGRVSTSTGNQKVTAKSLVSSHSMKLFNIWQKIGRTLAQMRMPLIATPTSTHHRTSAEMNEISNTENKQQLRRKKRSLPTTWHQFLGMLTTSRNKSNDKIPISAAKNGDIIETSSSSNYNINSLPQQRLVPLHSIRIDPHTASSSNALSQFDGMGLAQNFGSQHLASLSNAEIASLQSTNHGTGLVTDQLQPSALADRQLIYVPLMPPTPLEPPANEPRPASSASKTSPISRLKLRTLSKSLIDSSRRPLSRLMRKSVSSTTTSTTSTTRAPRPLSIAALPSSSLALNKIKIQFHPKLGLTNNNHQLFTSSDLEPLAMPSSFADTQASVTSPTRGGTSRDANLSQQQKYSLAQSLDNFVSPSVMMSPASGEENFARFAEPLVDWFNMHQLTASNANPTSKHAHHLATQQNINQLQAIDGEKLVRQMLPLASHTSQSMSPSELLLAAHHAHGQLPFSRQQHFIGHKEQQEGVRQTTTNPRQEGQGNSSMLIDQQNVATSLLNPSISAQPFRSPTDSQAANYLQVAAAVAAAHRQLDIRQQQRQRHDIDWYNQDNDIIFNPLAKFAIRPFSSSYLPYLTSFSGNHLNLPLTSTYKRPPNRTYKALVARRHSNELLNSLQQQQQQTIHHKQSFAPNYPLFTNSIPQQYPHRGMLLQTNISLNSPKIKQLQKHKSRNKILQQRFEQTNSSLPNMMISSSPLNDHNKQQQQQHADILSSDGSEISQTVGSSDANLNTIQQQLLLQVQPMMTANNNQQKFIVTKPQQQQQQQQLRQVQQPQAQLFVLPAGATPLSAASVVQKPALSLSSSATAVRLPKFLPSINSITSKFRKHLQQTLKLSYPQLTSRWPALASTAQPISVILPPLSQSNTGFMQPVQAPQTIATNNQQQAQQSSATNYAQLLQYNSLNPTIQQTSSQASFVDNLIKPLSLTLPQQQYSTGSQESSSSSSMNYFNELGDSQNLRMLQQPIRIPNGPFSSSSAQVSHNFLSSNSPELSGEDNNIVTSQQNQPFDSLDVAQTTSGEELTTNFDADKLLFGDSNSPSNLINKFVNLNNSTHTHNNNAALDASDISHLLATPSNEGNLIFGSVGGDMRSLYIKKDQQHNYIPEMKQIQSHEHFGQYNNKSTTTYNDNYINNSQSHRPTLVHALDNDVSHQKYSSSSQAESNEFLPPSATFEILEAPEMSLRNEQQHFQAMRNSKVRPEIEVSHHQQQSGNLREYEQNLSTNSIDTNNAEVLQQKVTDSANVQQVTAAPATTTTNKPPEPTLEQDDNVYVEMPSSKLQHRPMPKLRQNLVHHTKVPLNGQKKDAIMSSNKMKNIDEESNDESSNNDVKDSVGHQYDNSSNQQQQQPESNFTMTNEYNSIDDSTLITTTQQPPQTTTSAHENDGQSPTTTSASSSINQTNCTTMQTNDEFSSDKQNTKTTTESPQTNDDMSTTTISDEQVNENQVERFNQHPENSQQQANNKLRHHYSSSLSSSIQHPTASSMEYNFKPITASRSNFSDVQSVVLLESKRLDLADNIGNHSQHYADDNNDEASDRSDDQQISTEEPVIFVKAQPERIMKSMAERLNFPKSSKLLSSSLTSNLNKKNLASFGDDERASENSFSFTNKYDKSKLTPAISPSVLTTSRPQNSQSNNHNNYSNHNMKSTYLAFNSLQNSDQSLRQSHPSMLKSKIRWQGSSGPPVDSEQQAEQHAKLVGGMTHEAYSSQANLTFPSIDAVNETTNNNNSYTHNEKNYHKTATTKQESQLLEPMVIDSVTSITPTIEQQLNNNTHQSTNEKQQSMANNKLTTTQLRNKSNLQSIDTSGSRTAPTSFKLSSSNGGNGAAGSATKIPVAGKSSNFELRSSIRSSIPDFSESILTSYQQYSKSTTSKRRSVHDDNDDSSILAKLVADDHHEYDERDSIKSNVQNYNNNRRQQYQPQQILLRA